MKNYSKGKFGIKFETWDSNDKSAKIYGENGAIYIKDSRDFIELCEFLKEYLELEKDQTT